MSTLKYWNGTSWTDAFPPASPQTNQIDNYTTAGAFTITPPAGARFLWLELIGGGGNGSAYAGAGGGAYQDALVRVADLPTPLTLNVGAAENPTTLAGYTAPAGQSAPASPIAAGQFGGHGGGLENGGMDGKVGGHGLTGGGGGDGNRSSSGAGGSSKYGAGGGSASSSSGSEGRGGQNALSEGRLKAGNGGTSSVSPGSEAPGGAGGKNQPGKHGGARLTWIF